MATRKTSADEAVFAQHGLTPAEIFRPDVATRLELLRIVWRADRDAATTIKVAAELEQYVNGKAPE
jgi:hypothetical protein